MSNKFLMEFRSPSISQLSPIHNQSNSKQKLKQPINFTNEKYIQSNERHLESIPKGIQNLSEGKKSLTFKSY